MPSKTTAPPPKTATRAHSRLDGRPFPKLILLLPSLDPMPGTAEPTVVAAKPLSSQTHRLPSSRLTQSVRSQFRRIHGLCKRARQRLSCVASWKVLLGDSTRFWGTPSLMITAPFGCAPWFDARDVASPNFWDAPRLFRCLVKSIRLHYTTHAKHYQPCF